MIDIAQFEVLVADRMARNPHFKRESAQIGLSPGARQRGQRLASLSDSSKANPAPGSVEEYHSTRKDIFHSKIPLSADTLPAIPHQ